MNKTRSLAESWPTGVKTVLPALGSQSSHTCCRDCEGTPQMSTTRSWKQGSALGGSTHLTLLGGQAHTQEFQDLEGFCWLIH